jgi:hypothetical protein
MNQAVEFKNLKFKCFYLKKIDFADLLRFWLISSRIDFQAFEKICKCNMKFVFDAAQGGVKNYF